MFLPRLWSGSLNVLSLEKLKKVKGDIAVNIKKMPPGEGKGHHEAPRGETFHYVRSDGSNNPVRVKVRAPTYVNLPTCKATVPGVLLLHGENDEGSG